ncbi:MAG: hypothetical protein Q4D98_13590 [Planctomycetia bacterium]|nr:hypothetical protein [Planctomycetia bacterium]
MNDNRIQSNEQVERSEMEKEMGKILKTGMNGQSEYYLQNYLTGIKIIRFGVFLNIFFLIPSQIILGSEWSTSPDTNSLINGVGLLMVNVPLLIIFLGSLFCFTNSKNARITLGFFAFSWAWFQLLVGTLYFLRVTRVFHLKKSSTMLVPLLCISLLAGAIPCGCIVMEVYNQPMDENILGLLGLGVLFLVTLGYIWFYFLLRTLVSETQKQFLESNDSQTTNHLVQNTQEEYHE